MSEVPLNERVRGGVLFSAPEKDQQALWKYSPVKDGRSHCKQDATPCRMTGATLHRMQPRVGWPESL